MNTQEPTLTLQEQIDAVNAQQEEGNKDTPYLGGIEGNKLPRNPIRDILGARSPAETISFAKILIYADAGTGKTELCGTVCDEPEMMPALHLDVENGAMTIKRRHELDVVQVRNMKKMDDVHNEIKKQGDPPYYKTLLIDNITELEQIEMKEIMQLAFNANPATQDINVPSPREYGISNTKMAKYLRAYKDLPCHIICTAWVRYIKDSNGVVIGYEPNLGAEAIRKNGVGYFDVVGYMTATKAPGQPVKRKIQFVKTDRVVAKDRSWGLPESMEDPTLPKIWAAMKEGSNVTPVTP